MPYNPNKHHRKSIRLKGYDYSQTGLYFITICCLDRACLFGEIVGAYPCGRPDNDYPQNNTPVMQLNDAGKMIDDEWLKLPQRFENIQLHEYIVMPNHFHGILEITNVNTVGAPLVDAYNNDEILAKITRRPQIDDITGQLQGRPQGHAPTAGKTVGDMMDAFKSITTIEYIRGVTTSNWQRFNGKLWQRNYYEHIIRNEQSYETISNYIIDNPAKWLEDKFYTAQ